MDSLFSSFFKLGRDHILDIAGYDHILFLLALCIPFLLRDWRKVIFLATAFTIGHSLTLGLAVYDIIRFSPTWVEFLIPLTILMTGIHDFFKTDTKVSTFTYLSTLLFGLIHGMGFSNFLRASLFPGEESKLGIQLLAFNLGVEWAQILVVIVMLSILSLIYEVNRKKRYPIQQILSVIVIIWALVLMIDRWP